MFVIDLGKQLDLSGPDTGAGSLTSGTYRGGNAAVPAPFLVGRAEAVTLELYIALDAATNLTAVNFKLRLKGRDGGTSDVATVRGDQLGSGTASVQAFTVASGDLTAGATSLFYLRTTDEWANIDAMELVAEGVGGATKAGDRVHAYVTIGA